MMEFSASRQDIPVTDDVGIKCASDKTNFVWAEEVNSPSDNCDYKKFGIKFTIWQHTYKYSRNSE